MASYELLKNQTALQTAPPPVVPVKPDGNPNPNMATQKQSFHLVVSGTAGNVSGTAQVVASNDGINWVAYGDPIAASSAYLTSQAFSEMNSAFKYFGAYLTAISGTNAKATLTMSA